MVHLETERLKFRQWKQSDYEPFSQYFASEEHTRFLGGFKGPEDAWRLMATYIGHYELNSFSYPAIVEKDTNRLIGTIGLWKSKPWPEHELGYWLLPQSQGKGYGTEAGMVVKEFAKTLEFPSLVSYIDAENVSSKQLAIRLGAKLDGSIELLDFGMHEVYRYW